MMIANLLYSEIRNEIEMQWQTLPSHFRLNKPLRDCSAHTPFERDFLAGTRLEYLHTLFLLSLSSQSKISEPDRSMLEIAGDILSLVVEVIILRDRLANSGTSLVWKASIIASPMTYMI